MPDIHAQLAWEKRMIAHGVARYRAQQDKAIEGGRAHETSVGATLLRSYVLQISDRLKLYLDGKHPDGRRRNKYAKLLASIDTDKTAMMALKAIIATLYNPRSVQSTCVSVGRTIEDELRFSKFEEEYKAYYDEIIRNWEKRKTSHTGHKRRVLSVKARDMGVQWEPWPRDVLFGVGSLVISLLMEVCDLIELTYVPIKGGRKEAYIGPTDACIEWVMRHNAMAEIGNPDKMPCLIPPADWVSPTSGGYYSAQLQMRCPLVKSKRTPVMDREPMPQVLEAINIMQRTPWTLNRRVLEVMREVWHKNLGIGMPRSAPYVIPPSPIPEGVTPASLPEGSPEREAFDNWKAEARVVHTMERERVSKNLAVSRVIRIAADMEQYDEFYYVYNTDFRGRVYSATSGLSPQGTDHGKALLQFADAKPLGARGLYWLKVHGANKWGNDKCSRDEQVQWIEERHDDWLRVADDPIGNREVWSGADKPYQFLAFCFEYAEAHRLGDAFRSRLPIALDGTCNGLQHFSAMLRDEVGGSAVNLVPGERPADIYQEVADVCTRKLHELRSMNGDESGGAANWLACFGMVWGEERMFRKLPKKPVMTLPYGSTQQACTDTIFQWQQENAPDQFERGTAFRHAMYLSPKLWSSISEVVVAARQAMDWIQTCAGVLAKEGHPIYFQTPLGFEVWQSDKKYITQQIETQINGRLRLRMVQEQDKFDARKMRQGSSPNFVHAVDATHLMMVVLAASARGVGSFAMIHDDYGTHACDVDVLQEVIRDEFVKLHSIDLLQVFKDQNEARTGVELPDLPAKGTLDISVVRKSPYFFG